LGDDRAPPMFELPQSISPLLQTLGVGHPHRRREMLRDIGRDLNRLDHVAEEQPAERLLADVRVRILPAEVGTVVVDVTPLLDLRRERAAALCTRQQTHESVTPFVARTWLAAEDFLNAVKRLMAHKWFVRSLSTKHLPILNT